MCPSYMATLDERHSTRGRGNALRLAITGQLSELRNGESFSSPAWNDQETLATLNLCLSCKACKSECPSNVDIAKYKAEYLAQGYRSAGRVPLKALAFGRVRMLNQIGSLLAPLSNWVANSALHRAIINPLLGLARERTLPAWAPSLFRLTEREESGAARPRGERASADDRSAPTVVLYADCFTTYNEPEIGLSTLRVLRSFGYRVLLPRVECCGRAEVSTGLLEHARASAARSAGDLLDSVRRSGAQAVLVCEPSCLSAMKDDWHTLRLPGVDGDDLRMLASMSYLPEQFIEEKWADHPRRPNFAAPRGAVALHGHCHQKALWGAETSAALLRRLAGDRLRVLDTGCCGMAGSFGYTADRYQLSMKIGELALFPAVRSLGAEDDVVAPGTSCRHQIHDGVLRRALHPMQFVERLMPGV